MLRRNFNLLVFLLALFFTSCGDDDEVSVSFESYRYELWKKLIDKGIEFDFIGTETDPGNYPDYMGRSFDRDHQGADGAQTEDLINNLDDILANIPTPDVVLLGIGMNDLLAGDEPMDIISNIHEIIDILQENNPDVDIVLETTLSPPTSDTFTDDFLKRFNELNQKLFLTEIVKSSSGSDVWGVDMRSAWKNAYLADRMNYNESGAEEVADRYLNPLSIIFSVDEKNYTVLPLGDSRVKGNRPG